MPSASADPHDLPRTYVKAGLLFGLGEAVLIQFGITIPQDGFFPLYFLAAAAAHILIAVVLGLGWIYERCYHSRPHVEEWFFKLLIFFAMGGFAPPLWMWIVKFIHS